MEAKLEILTFDLEKYANSEEKNATFEKFYKAKVGSSDMAKVFKKFVSLLDNPKNSTYKVTGRKAFTLLSKASGFEKNEEAVYGIIKGGDIGDGKTKSNLKNRNVDEILDGNVINDKYFFLLYTPLKSSRGYLFLQTYKDDGIKRAFVDSIMREIFSIYGEYKIPKAENFYPKKIRDEFQKNASVKKIKFSDTVLSSSFSSDSSFKSISRDFKVEVIITPVGGGVSKKVAEKLFSSIGLQKMGRQLKDFSEKNITVKNDITKKISHFQLGRDFNDVKPRIYLDKSKIRYDAYGIPDFDSLKKYTFELLKEIKEESNTRLKNTRRNDT